ncbi:hypothetical protein BDP27DRAFT_1422509 [Rhodocollybia butyracea]|uniref:DUF6534 domain-containing protein n=1 Tax=Rhodocollybia butyracea TaxID=206335 RepID=A0A9P5U6H0_9AGAR|nr:hypothetical protein BDP27DRAFT_1422509 [Rhodocollybia butyracea]
MSSFFDATNGSGLIGSWLSASMYGVTLAQTYIFFNRPLRSSTFLRMLVLCLWLLDTIHTAVVCTTVYHYSVSNAFNEAAILNTTWSITVSLELIRTIWLKPSDKLQASVGINVVVVTICQLYFVSIVYKLCKKTWLRISLTAVIMIFIILHFGWGLGMFTLLTFTLVCDSYAIAAVVIFMAPRKTFAEYSTKQSVGFLPYAISQLPVDFAIAGSLCILLYKKRTGFQRTETIINTLILYAVNSVVALVEALAVGIAPDSFWFSAAEFVIGQLYTNSLLAMLNGKDLVQDGGRSWSIHSHPLVALPLQNMTRTLPMAGIGHKNEDLAGHNSTYDNEMSECQV